MTEQEQAALASIFEQAAGTDDTRGQIIIVGRENVIAGTDCGFAQGSPIARQHPSIMWAKLESLVEGGRIASREQVRVQADAMNWREQLIHWRRAGNACVPYTATHGGHALTLRIGDFPAEHLYTLIVDGVEVSGFSGWPPGWVRPDMPPPEGGDTASGEP